jgi:hypothetical protein
MSKNDWKFLLKADPTNWLLEENNPSVRYFTLTDILDLPVDSREAIKARKQIMKIGVVPGILARQEDGGYWGIPENFYEHSKYKGTIWQLIVLAELGADGSDDLTRKACEFVLKNSQDRKSGGFSIYGNPDNGGKHGMVIPCLTGNMVYSLIRLGYLEDSRVQKGIDWITTYQRFDDRTDNPPNGWPYDIKYGCWGRHTCSMGAIKALKALAEIPEQERSPDVKATLSKGVEYFLQHHVYKRSHNLLKAGRVNWTRFGFPLMYQTEALEILGVLTKLGYHDPRMQDAIDLLLSKQDNQGRWMLETTFNGRFLVDIEAKDKPSKWITLNALRVLRAYTTNGNRISVI